MSGNIILLFGAAFLFFSVGDKCAGEQIENSQGLKDQFEVKPPWKLTSDMEEQLDVLLHDQPKSSDFDVALGSQNARVFFPFFNPRLCRAANDHSSSLPEPQMEWTKYHSLKDIYDWVDYIGQEYAPILKTFTIGYSYERRPIKAVKLSLKKGNKAIFIESGIHAIEWISSAVGTCFLKNLLTSNDPELRELVWNYDWIFVPMLNPDGFEYTKLGKLWRKNRKPTGFSNSSGPCYGVDLNRNFNFNWNGAGYNIKEPCDHFYGGRKPDSEPEVLALQNFVNCFPTGYIRMYLALHSYGNLLLLPYGHTITERPPNYDQMLRISKGFADNAFIPFNTTFRYGASGELLNIVSGAAKDWAYGVKGIQYSATVELRDTGRYGFFLPADQIEDTCAEFTAGIVGIMKAAEEENLFA